MGGPAGLRAADSGNFNIVHAIAAAGNAEMLALLAPRIDDPSMLAALDQVSIPDGRPCAVARRNNNLSLAQQLADLGFQCP